MDRERLGRVLGKGARAAARTAWEAVDAATAPSPTPPARPRATATQPAAPEVIPPRRTAPATPAPSVAPPQFANAARAAAAGVAAPLRTASRALWHELTGSFFALFALSFSVGAWRWRAGAFSSVQSERFRFYFVCGLAVLFAYFSVSNFVRASRRK